MGLRRSSGLGRIGVAALLAAAAIAACGNDSSSAGDAPVGPDGSDGSTTSPSTTTDGAAAGDATDDSATAPTVRDPFAAQSRAANDFPSSSDYVVDNGAGLVTDKTTGLVWSRTPLSEAELPPDAGDGNPSTQVDARAQCENATIAGTKGWRLPTRLELLSIVSLDQAHIYDGTAFDTKSFDNLPIWIATDDTTRNAYYEGHYHVHSFRPNLDGTWFSASTHCVKAPYPVTARAQAPDASRFTANGTVLVDHVTHLEWFTKIDTTSKLWSQASDYCANLASADAGAPAGDKPWRLPTLKEAASLWLEASAGLPDAFGATASTIYVWTSAHYTPPPQIVANAGYYRLYFDKQRPSGDIFYDVNDFASTMCVRDGT